MTPASASSLIDPAPAIGLALLGAALALLPLGWVAWRRRRAAADGSGHGRSTSWRAALTLTTLILTFDLIVFGSFTRLTDSGLGCPDWPGCYGSVSPWGAKAHIDAAAAAQPDGPVTTGKAWIEMVHRYFAMVVGALIVAMTVAAWTDKTGAKSMRFWTSLTLVWVLVQGLFGALTVTMRLYPAIVTTHLLLGMGLLAVLAWQVGLDRQRAFTLSAPARHRTWAWVTAGVVLMQIALGGWVSTNYAVLACRDFPMCQGAWWPAADFAEGFQLTRPLGRNAQNDGYLPFAALTAIHLTHRAFALVVTAAVLSLAWRLRQGHRRLAWALVALLAWQLLSGISNVVLGWPILAAVAHVAGAALLVLVLVRWLATTSRATA
jgi:heme a synthase